MPAPALALYRALTRRGAGQGRRVLRKRLKDGKESASRIGEREGIAGFPRPRGRLVWFHAASVGESLSLIEVIRRLLDAPDLNVLVTTGTVTSADILAARLPDRALHQFAPLDLPDFVEPFLDHWRPDVAIFTESEFWPNMILDTRARGIPLLLLNARMSETSARRWALLRGAAHRLLGAFDAVQAQDAATGRALRRLGLPEVRLAVTGSLKEGTPPPPCEEPERLRLARHMDGRPVWLAASTHAGEEAACIAAHAIAARSVLRLLLVLVPRHADRGEEIARTLQEGGVPFARRSAGDVPGPDTAVYLADTMGEMGLWYRLAPVSFVGGSLVEIGGHNPFEPAALGSAILHGPHVANFADIYAKLDAANAAREVHDPASLAAALIDLSRPDRRAPMAYAAWDVTSSGAAATDKAVALIRRHLPVHDPAGA